MLGGALHVVVVLGEHDGLVEAADGLVDFSADEDAEAGRVRRDVLHDVEVHVDDLAREDVAGVALDGIDEGGGDGELALLELGDGRLDEVVVELVVGVEEEDQLAGGHARAGVAAGGRLAAVDDLRAVPLRRSARVASVDPASAMTI